MNTKDLNYFCSAYELRNIARAAEASYITPQGMSKVLQKLETELGVVLFERTKRGIIPTKYADALYNHAKMLIGSLDNITNLVQMDGEVRTRELTIAMTLGVIDYLSADFILDFQKEYPDIKLSVIMNPDYRVSEMIKRDEAEIGIIMGPVDVVSFDCVHFTSHYHCVMVNKKHPLASKKVISYQDLDKEPMAMVCREFSAYQNNMNRFLSAGVMPKLIFEATEIASIHKFVSENRGIGFSVDFAALAARYDNTVVLRLEDKQCKLDSYLIKKRIGCLTPEAQLFKEYALEWLAAHKDQLFNWDSMDS